MLLFEELKTHIQTNEQTFDILNNSKNKSQDKYTFTVK